MQSLNQKLYNISPQGKSKVGEILFIFTKIKETEFCLRRIIFYIQIYTKKYTINLLANAYSRNY